MNVNYTPPTSPPGTGDRNSHRDTFSSPPILASSVKSGTSSTPSTRPGSSKNLAIDSWFIPSIHGENGLDQVYGVDYFGGVAELKGAADDASTSYSTISLPSSFGKDKDAPLRRSALLQGKVDKPWLENKDWRIRASYWITVAMVFLGVAASALVCVTGYKSTPLITQPLCLVMSDEFNTFDTTNTWHQEIDMSGFQNGEFEMTTASPNNSYVKDGKLYIVPTLTSDVIGVANVFDAYTYNITGCTNTNPNAIPPDQGCGAVSNATGGTVINPIMSARITTQKSYSISYGKVEIVAKMPTGDWLWPAIWMLPVNNTYGPWPLSGEIDIVNSRGNAPTYPDQGRNYIRSFLNWGPTVSLTRAFKTSGYWFDRRGSFANGFHTYTLEWTSDFLRVYVDSRLKKSLDIRFNTPFFARGDFPPSFRNNTVTIPLENPWAGRGYSAPFDQEFYLLMNVAVGGTDGIFADNVGGKPWIDASRFAMREFALAQDQWYPTWPANPDERGMVIDSVKMWKLC
ncbi:glycoside hydrolase family 16 protein [Hysterangium stoloniferum]|nr:glycoside hydrolase family 16 protein [Hysterangium stoloniferum]